MTSMQVGSVTSADVRCATASCRFGIEGVALGPEGCQPEFRDHRVLNCSATEANGPVRSP